MSRVPPANSTSHTHTPEQTQYNMRMPLNLGGRNIPPSAMRQARSYQTGHHQVTQSRKTQALRCPGVKYADGNSNYHGRGKPKEKPLFERVPKLANVPGTAGEENLAIQDKTSTLKPTTSNRSARKGYRGYGRALVDDGSPTLEYRANSRPPNRNANPKTQKANTPKALAATISRRS